jgi:hypothetical protein
VVQVLRRRQGKGRPSQLVRGAGVWEGVLSIHNTRSGQDHPKANQPEEHPHMKHKQPNPNQTLLFKNDEQQIKEYNLKKLQQLKQEAKANAAEWLRKQRLTMLGERKGE